MAASKKPALVVAREGFIGEVDGQTISLSAGDLVESNHPIVRKWPDLFKDPELRYPVIEQATAAPGERRRR